MKTAALLGTLLLTLFIAPSPSHAARTVETLLENCESDDTTKNVGCAAFLKGVAGVLNSNCGFAAQGYSVPEFMKTDAGEVTVAALIQTFKNWARGNPQSWSEDELTGVILAMSSTFPCKN